MPDAAARALLAAAARRTIALPENGVEIALLDWGGNGPLALLHHANGFCKGVWGLVADALRDRYHVLSMDARGHGDSSKPSGPGAYKWDRFAEDVVGVATRLAGEHGDGRVALAIGNSFGGTAFLGAAARRPDLFTQLVLVDPVVPPPPNVPRTPERVAAMNRLVEGARKRRAHFSSRAEACAQWAKRKLFARWDRRALALYAEDGLRNAADGGVELKCPPEVEATIFAESGSLDLFAIARQVVTPVLMLWAAQGDFPRPVYEVLASSMADGRVETLEAGHLTPMERPDLVVDAALRFVQTFAITCSA